MAEGVQRSDVYVSVEQIQVLWLSKTIGRTIVAPMDRVKYLLQCQGELRRLGLMDGGFRGAWHCARHLARVEGARSFWRGNLIQVVSILPITLAQLFIALPTQVFVFNALPRRTELGSLGAAYASVVAGAFSAAIVSYPLEFARFRLACDVKSFHGAPYMFRHSLAFFSAPVFADCLHLLYTGLGLYIAGSIVYQSVHDGMLRVLGPLMPPETADSGRGPVVVQVATGLTISALSTLCLHPVDTVRRRMMLAVMHDDWRYASASSCVRSILSQEGPLGLYRGAAFTLVRMLVTTSLFAYASIPT